jgi:hypothetical protein
VTTVCEVDQLEKDHEMLASRRQGSLESVSASSALRVQDNDDCCKCCVSEARERDGKWLNEGLGLG